MKLGAWIEERVCGLKGCFGRKILRVSPVGMPSSEGIPSVGTKSLGSFSAANNYVAIILLISECISRVGMSRTNRLITNC